MGGPWAHQLPKIAVYTVGIAIGPSGRYMPWMITPFCLSVFSCVTLAGWNNLSVFLAVLFSVNSFRFVCLSGMFSHYNQYPLRAEFRISLGNDDVKLPKCHFINLAFLHQIIISSLIIKFVYR